MPWSVLRLIFKTSSVTPDFFKVFYLILSFSTCRQSFNKIRTWEAFGANGLKMAEIFENLDNVLRDWAKDKVQKVLSRH